MDAIKSELIVRIDDLLQSKAQDSLFRPQDILKPLKDVGFHSCLFYDATYNVAKDDFQLILSAIEGPPEQKKYLGSKVDYKETAIANFPKRTIPIVQTKNDSKQSSQLQFLTERLGVHDKFRVHTPVYYRGVLIGALSCAWDGELNDLTQEHIEGITIIGSLLTRYWSMTNNSIITKILKDIKNNIGPKQNGNDLSPLLDKVTELTLSAVGGRVGALFHYNWYGHRLDKQYEAYSGSVRHEKFEEGYFVNDCLTGTAWTDEKFRHVADFDDLRERYKVHVNNDSFDHHTKLLGKVSSILYCPLGNKSKYLFRLINREDDNDLPFLSSHMIILQNICRELGEIVNDVVSDKKLTNIQAVASSAISNITDPNKTIEKARAALSFESINKFGVFACNPKYQHFSHKYYTDKELNAAIKKYVIWTDSPFFKACMEKTSISSMAISDFDESKISGHFVEILKGRGINFVLVVPFTSPQLKGFLLITTPPDTPSTAKALLSRLPQEHIESLKAHAAILGNCIETASSHLTAENATRLIGHIGHEVEGPIAELGQAGIDVIYKAIEFIEEIQTNNGLELEDIIETIEKEVEVVGGQMEQINILMDVAIDMAQESQGALQVHFKTYDLYDVLERAKDEALRTEYRDYKDRKHKVVYEFNDRAKNMPKLVGDTTLLHKVFVNVFRNAQKYSLPDGSKGPIKIKVHGISQSNQNIIKVKNWGIRIPEDFEERIFNAFERGDIHDRLKARRGMGLGLYIARRFLAAHKGSIFLQEHKPNFDDPDRRDVEGWNTTFEIRLPFWQTKGTYDVEI